MEAAHKELEEERERIRIERQRLEEERDRMKHEQFDPPVKKQHTSKESSVEKESRSRSDKKDDSSNNELEMKLSMLEERLKNIDYRGQGNEGESSAQFKNDIVPDDVEFVSEPVGDRAQTGISGLDPIIQGGLRRLSTTLVAGGPGSGKTIFSMQFLINGIEKYNEAGVFVTFEQTKEELYDLFMNFGWDLKQYEKEKKLRLLHFTPEQVAKIMSSGGGSLRDSIDTIHASRVVIDSLTDLMMLYSDDIAKRQACMDLFDIFKKLKCTTVCTAEQEVNPMKHISNVLEYQVDGVILLYNERVGDIRQRAIEIFKMRGTKHAGRIFPIKVSDTGVLILSDHPIKTR